MPAETSPAAISDAPEISTRVLQCALFYVSDHFGADTVEQLAGHAGLTTAELRNPSRWISFQQFGTILQHLYELVGTEDRFKEVCAYRVSDAYGAIRYVFAAA